MRTAATALLTLMLASRAAAAPVPVTADKLHVRLAVDEPQAEALGADDKWADACAAIGKALSAGQAAWGLGPFSNYDCGVGKAEEQTPGTWTLTVTHDGKRASLAVTLAGFAKPLATTGFEGRQWALDLLAAPEMAALLAADLMDQLPMMARLDAPLYDESRGVITAKPAKKSGKPLPPPATLSIYTLAVDPQAGVFQPHLVTTAKLVGNGKKSPFVWKLTTKPPAGQTLWAHNAKGRKTYAASAAKRIGQLNRTLVARHESWAGRLGLYRLGDIMSDGVASGFVGVRYGHSIFQGPVIDKMSVVSLVTELRGSPLDGLRLYYDVWPEAAQPAPEGAVLFQGQRLTLGWSFGLKLGGLIDRVDVVPKLGRWSVQTDFAVVNPDGSSRTIPFKVSNALSLGIEAGAETSLNWTLLRAWLSRDFGYNPFLKGQSTQVTNTRAGLDALLKGPSFLAAGMPFSLSFLVFGFYENVTLEKTGGPETTDITVDQVSYNVAYLGGGLALSW